MTNVVLLIAALDGIAGLLRKINLKRWAATPITIFILAQKPPRRGFFAIFVGCKNTEVLAEQMQKLEPVIFCFVTDALVAIPTPVSP